MIVLRAKLLPLRIAANACRTLSTETTERPLYWHAKFLDKKPRSFDEMPTVEAKLDPYKTHEVFPQWFKKYGFVLRQPVGNDKYIVHTFHFDDFETIYQGDTEMAQRPSHQVLEQYRRSNKELYENLGLVPGNEEYVERMRGLIVGNLDKRADEKMEKVVDDLIEIIRAKVGEGDEIELLPWLFRWCFENVGLAFLDKRLGALSQTGNEEADKMVEAAAIANEMIALTTIDPETNYAEHYQKFDAAQNYFYSILKKCIEEVASQPDSECAIKEILKNSLKDAITVTLDGFQIALQTVPLSVLMALYNVARNKDVQVRAREELMKYLPTKDSKYILKTDRPCPQAIQNILWESLRLNPPIIGNGRIIQRDLVLGGYNVPKETTVILHFQVASRLEEFYENPLEFNPNRFKSLSADQVKQVFGGSSRVCIGAGFANDTIILILSKLLRNFEFFFDGGEIAIINRLNNVPEKPLFLRVKPLPE